MLRLDVVNLVCTVLNLLLIYFLMKKFLFGRVNKIIEERQNLIKNMIDDADETKKAAEAKKAEYEASLADAKSESDRIVAEAKEKARAEYDRIVNSADAEVAKKIHKAEETIEEEKAKALRDMENEIEGLVVSVATKVVGQEVNKENSQKLYDDFLNSALKETGDK